MLILRICGFYFVTKINKKTLFLLYSCYILVEFLLFMQKIGDIFFTFWTLVRGYSMPISIMSWIVPFLFALFSGGSLRYGLLALFGILFVHMASNLFDDIIDYIREKKDIDKGLKSDFNFQKGKCIVIRDGRISLNKAIFIDFILFLIPLLIGIYFIYIWEIELFYIIIPAAILCLLYPILGCLGLGEVVIAIIFSPLIYIGVYYAMTGGFSVEILLISISTGFLCISVLHNHMLLDFCFDKENRKITLCTLCKNKVSALNLLSIFVLFSYLNLIVCIFFGKLSLLYLLPFLTIPSAILLIKNMKLHIDNPKNKIKYNILMGFMPKLNDVTDDEKNFLMKFFLAQNLLTSFTLLLCISIILDFKCI